MSIYQVVGPLEFAGYKPGETFETTLDRGAEYRALRRRNIRIIEVSKPALQPGSFTLPDGWLTSEREV